MDLSPKQITAELDRFIIGQQAAKRAVAVALRNRYRRSCLPDAVREEITPKNIIMKGPTGVGKTEIARRLAKLVKAPFIKVEATKYTEVGYVGRDCESMIRDLTEVAVRLVREEKFSEVESKARAAAESRIIDAIVRDRKARAQDTPEPLIKAEVADQLRSGALDKQAIEIDVADRPKPMELVPGSGMEMINIGDIMGGMFGGKKKKKRKMTVKEALDLMIAEEGEKLIDNDAITAEAVRRAEQDGIIFIDEIDKIAAKSSQGGGSHDVSREGVQRDILPIVEGSTVITKYGPVKTDFVLFIASGAFHISKMEDLIPELQGRFPVKVELDSLKHKDFVDILTIPENAITRQYAHLLSVDSIKLTFTADAVDEIAAVSVLENETSENIGARRLHNIIELLLEDISFNADGQHPEIEVIIDRAYVKEHLKNTTKKHDLTKYIL
ncbi:MAG: ATP-dependent protease ATPase subunit HslU [Clostridiales bacterium]|jgi:ATP-dependent HslUV protease ATP-binding subunit HslU|nr:ATP-dependent protease ATPase subunit HslU [Clostridiales bacterium]